MVPKKTPAITKAMIRKAVSIDFCLKLNAIKYIQNTYHLINPLKKNTTILFKIRLFINYHSDFHSFGLVSQSFNIILSFVFNSTLYFREIT